MYKAAGLLPVSINDDGNVVVLVALEFRHRYKKVCMIDVGGKIEPEDANSWETANREFNEETGYPKFPNSSYMRSINSSQFQYVTHLVYMDYKAMMPKVEDAADTVSALLWVPLSELFQIRDDQHPIIRAIDVHHRLLSIIREMWKKARDPWRKSIESGFTI
jgi:8-oxo-dGTP pyrophosphatase MutT (NUDIX family)